MMSTVSKAIKRQLRRCPINEASFIKSPLVPQLLHKDDKIKIVVDDDFMINTGFLDPSINGACGVVLTDLQEFDEVEIALETSNEVIRVPSFFCAMKGKDFKFRLLHQGLV